MSQKPPKKDTTSKILVARSTEELIAVMQEEDEASEREQILEKMCPALKEKLEFCQNWMKQELGRSLRSRYELGQQVLELYRDETNNKARVYGRGAIDRICKILHWDDGLIRLSLRFAQSYTPQQVEEMCSCLLPNGQPLSWSHVRCLVTVEDKKQRQMFLDQTLEEGWTCTELAREMKILDRGGMEEKRGRPPKMPKDFDGAIALQKQSAEAWDKQYSRVWSHPKRSLMVHVAKLSPFEITNDRLREARELAGQLRRVAQQATEQAEAAEQIVKDMEGVLLAATPPQRSQ